MADRVDAAIAALKVVLKEAEKAAIHGGRPAERTVGLINCLELGGDVGAISDCAAT